MKQRGKLGPQYVTGLYDKMYINALVKLERATVRDVANEINGSISGTRNRLHKMEQKGLVECEIVGNKFVFWV